MYVCMYGYIYTYRERERCMYMYIERERDWNVYVSCCVCIRRIKEHGKKKLKWVTFVCFLYFVGPPHEDVEAARLLEGHRGLVDAERPQGDLDLIFIYHVHSMVHIHVIICLDLSKYRSYRIL